MDHALITPMPAESPERLASALIDDFAKGREPVWPSTPGRAALLAAGLRTLRQTIPDSVDYAVSQHPVDPRIDWATLLAA